MDISEESKTTIQRIREEGPLTMAQAAEVLAAMGDGLIRSPVTMAGYCRYGLRGVLLDAYAGPSGWITSKPALIRWLAALHDQRKRELGRLCTPGALAEKAELEKQEEARGPDGMTEGERATLALKQLIEARKAARRKTKPKPKG